VVEEDSVFLKTFKDAAIPQEEEDFEKIFPKDDYVTARLRYMKENSERDLYVRTPAHSWQNKSNTF